jgi:acyl-CoA thioesterase FadM
VDSFSRPYEVRPSDLDGNGHVNYAAYIDAAAAVRYAFFADHGFPPERFSGLGQGPIYTELHARFLREVLAGETLTITYALTGLSPGAGRWKVHHDLITANGKKAVSLDLEGALLDLTTRRPALPSPELAHVFALIPRSHGFEVLPDSLWRA